MKRPWLLRILGQRPKAASVDDYQVQGGSRRCINRSLIVAVVMWSTTFIAFCGVAGFRDALVSERSSYKTSEQDAKAFVGDIR